MAWVAGAGCGAGGAAVVRRLRSRMVRDLLREDARSPMASYGGRDGGCSGAMAGQGRCPRERGGVPPPAATALLAADQQERPVGVDVLRHRLDQVPGRA